MAERGYEKSLLYSWRGSLCLYTLQISRCVDKPNYTHVDLTDIVDLHESIPLTICGSRCGSWQLPETRPSRLQCPPSGSPSDATSSGTKQRSARLGTAGRRA